MRKEENLFVIAQEECAEVQQEIAKALRFGLNSHHPSEPETTNRERILTEYYQLQAVMEILMNTTPLGTLPESRISKIKSDKVTNVMKYGCLSEKLGLIDKT